MARRSRQSRSFRLVTLVPRDLVRRIDAVVSRSEFPTTRSDVVRTIIERALCACQQDENGVRAAV